MNDLTIEMPPPCAACGAKAGDNHEKSCGWLSCLRASVYPRVLDDNGIGWEANLISKLQCENKLLRDALDKIGSYSIGCSYLDDDKNSMIAIARKALSSEYSGDK